MAISAGLGEPRVLRIEDGALAYRDTGGTGLPVLFVHGVLVNADLWRAVVPALGTGFRCVAPDWPLGGHEYALAPHADLRPSGLAATIAEVLERLDLRDAILVGSDTGTALVQIALAHYPERIGGVVLTNGDAYDQYFPAPLNALPTLARLPGVARALATLLRTDAGGRALAASIAHAAPDPAILRSFLGGTRNREVLRDLRKVLTSVEPAYTREAAAHFGAFVKPVAIGWGDDDLFFAPSVGARLAGDFPNASLRHIPRARTLVPEDAPLAVAELVREVAARS